MNITFFPSHRQFCKRCTVGHIVHAITYDRTGTCQIGLTQVTSEGHWGNMSAMTANIRATQVSGHGHCGDHGDTPQVLSQVSLIATNRRRIYAAVINKLVKVI